MTSRISRHSSQEEEAMLSLLLLFHRRKQEQARKNQPNARYARIVDHFQSRARRLMDERAVTEELIERLLQGGRSLPPRAPHQEVVLRGPAGGHAAGRIRVRNAAAESAAFELVIGGVLDGAGRLPIRCEPSRGTLAAGATQLVRVAADLGERAPGERLTVALECRWRTGRDYVWLVVETEPVSR